MDLSTTLSLVQTILTAIQTLTQMPGSISDLKSELKDLKKTVEIVESVLMDADAKQDSLNFQEQKYVKELKDAVYDADDVLDEFLTLAKQQQLRDGSDKFSDKVRSFFSRFKHLTHNLSSKVKMVNDKLDKIANKFDKFSFKIECKPVKFTKEESSSFICDSDKIIGRDVDVKKIRDVLLGSDHPHVSLLAIVGMGGLGKTALAQLVYNDPRITEAFQLKRWTCIADQDQKQLDLKGHLGKVVKGFSVSDKMSLEDIHHVVKQQLGGQKYLLVLDDVWTESYDDWLKFKGFLSVGGSGSWIIVTTRSKKTAQMIGGDRVHVLQGLSEPDSWNLFERMAFQAVERDDELVKLGKEIVKKCINVPLAIRVVASLLRGQSKSKWLSFHDKGLDYLSESNDTMTRILKLSYDQLNPSLKACFAYCAIFPKDWEISKQTLIQLWMAQGYILSENLGEEYFLILLQRCFFQDIREDEFGGIKWFKIHDLLHDIAEKVAGEEICRFSFDTSNVDDKVRHLSFVSDPHAYNIFNSDTCVGKKVRTCLQIKNDRITDQLLASKCIPKWTCLRSLDLSRSTTKRLPKSIGQLLHLRNLDLSFSHHLEVLPKSITKLVNLQTFDLQHCSNLKQLPDGLSKLVDLSTLNLYGCDALSCMPAGIGMLTCLHTLCQFVVGERTSSALKQCFNGLEELQHLNKLKGELKIQIAVLKNANFVKEEHGGGAYLRSKQHLETIIISFRCGEVYESKESEQALLEEMQPHHDVKALELEGYHGETIPRWPGRGDNSSLFDLPNLVTLEIRHCSELLYLPWQIATLPNLENLKISDLPKVEYVADADSKTLVSGEGSSFFASLRNLVIYKLPKLKGWWWRYESGSLVVNPNDDGSSREANLERVSSDCIPLLKNLTIEHCEKTMSMPLWWRSGSGSLVGNPYDSGSSREANIEWVSSPCIPLLKNLTIEHCEKTMFIPLCPRLESLKICDYFRFLSWSDGIVHWQRPSPSPSPSYSKLKTLKINNLEWLKAMPMEYTQFISEIEIGSDESLESLGEVNDFPTCLCLWSSLLILRINSCPQLKSVEGWLEHLSALQNLRIYSCPKVVLDGVSWHNLAGTLRSLELAGIEEMEELPEGMQYCTSLQFLVIEGWPKMKSLPKWMPKLTSLQELELWHCSESLIERCQQPNGEDWPLIQHIQHISGFSV